MNNLREIKELKPPECQPGNTLHYAIWLRFCVYMNIFKSSYLKILPDIRLHENELFEVEFLFIIFADKHIRYFSMVLEQDKTTILLP